MNINTCNQCGTDLKPCFTSMFCPNECDLSKKAHTGETIFVYYMRSELINMAKRGATNSSGAKGPDGQQGWAFNPETEERKKQRLAGEDELADGWIEVSADRVTEYLDNKVHILGGTKILNWGPQ